MQQKNNFTKQRITTLIIKVFIVLVIFTSCKKNTSDIGLNVQPEGDRLKLSYTDTISINTLTVLEDSLTSYRNSANLLGCYIDPVFGKAKASFLTHLRLTSQNVNFNTDSLYNVSMYLNLEKASTYGDGSTPQTVRVFELNDSIAIKETYYSDINASNYYDIADQIGEFTYIPDDIDSVLSIKLDDVFANRLLLDSSSNYIDNSTFLDYFKGIFVTVDDVVSDGAIVYYDLLSENSNATLYYGNREGEHTFEFGINSNCQRINSFSHDSTIITSVNNNPSINDSVLYIQGLGGVKAKLTFPFINNIRDLGQIAINKAELLVNLETNEASLNDFAVPSRMTLRAINENGTISLLPDDPIFNESNNYFNGYYDDNTKSYTINITRYFQYLLSEDYSDNGLYLFPYDKRITANRVVVTGANHSNGIKLLLTYTKL